MIENIRMNSVKLDAEKDTVDTEIIQELRVAEYLRTGRGIDPRRAFGYKRLGSLDTKGDPRRKPGKGAPNRVVDPQ